jgi:hypothetical protein
MNTLKEDLIKLGTTNPELRPYIRPILAGCEKLPEGGMRDNCEKKKSEGGDKEETDKGSDKEASLFHDELVKLGTTNPELRPHIRPLLAASTKEAGFINRLPMQYRIWADKVLGVLGKSGDPEDTRNNAYSFAVYLLSLASPEQAMLTDRLLARFRRQPMEMATGPEGSAQQTAWDYMA